MVMSRFFCWEVGLDVPFGKHAIESCPPRGADYGARAADLTSVLADSRAESLRRVLIAANIVQGRRYDHFAPGGRSLL